MKPFLALVSLNFKSLMLTSFNFGRGKKKAASGVGAFVLFSFLMLLISGTYSFSLGAALGPLGALDSMLIILLLIGLSMSVLFTLFAGQGTIYGTKDIDVVLSMPVSAFAVMLARMLALYLEVLVTVELFCLPAGIAYCVFGGHGGVVFWLVLLLGGALLSLLPTLLALVFGALISLLVSRMRHKNLFTTLFSLVFVVGIIVASTVLPSTAEVAVDNIAGLQAMLAGVFPPITWAVQAATGPSLLALLLLVAVCVVPFLLFTWLFSLFYKTLLTHLASFHLKNNYTLRGVTATSPFRALLKKEAGRFFGTPAYVLNCGVSIIMIVGVSVFAVFSKSAIHDFLAQMQAVGSGDLTPFIPPILVGTIALLQSLIYTAAVSISLEGKTLWILKEAPVSTRSIFAAKAGFNFLLSGLTVLVSAPLLSIAFALPAVDAVFITLLGVLYAAFSSMLNLYVNLLFPRLDAENDTIIIKQSASAQLGMLFGFVGTLVLVGIYFLLHFLFGASFPVFAAVAALLLALLCAGVAALLNTKGRRMFDAL